MTHKPQDQDCSANKAPSATSRALRLLAHKARSVAELAALLQAEGYEAEACAKAMQAVRTWGYLHDGRLGEATQAKAVRRGRGSRWLQDELASRKLPHEVRQEMAARHAEEEPAVLAALVARRFGRPGALATPRDMARALRFLLSRGFAPGAAGAALRRTATAQPSGRTDADTSIEETLRAAEDGGLA